LYPLYCTLYLCTLTLTRRHLQALVALSLAFVSDIFRFNSTVYCTLHWLQLRRLFSLPIMLRNLHTFCFILFVGSWAGATTALNFEHVRFLTHILLYCCQFFLYSFRPWAVIQPSPQF
jgi:hypothetical protein